MTGMLTLLGVPAADVAERVLVVGDPDRAARAAELLDGARLAGRNREYVTFTGSYRGVPVSVTSHGVGSAGAAICFEELCRAGVSVLVRAGTAGGLPERVRDGSLVVATAAVREDGVTPRLVPPSYPAVADAGIVRGLAERAAATGLDVHTGIVLTSDLFYPQQVLGPDLPLWHRAGCVAVEMELATLLVIASLHGARAGGILAVDGNPMAAQDTDMAGYQPFRDVVRTAVDAALSVALDVLVSG